VSAAGPAAFRPARAWEDYDHTPFQALPPATWSRELFLAGELTDALVSRHALAILQALGIPVPGHLDLLADDLALGAGVLDDRAYAFHWLWRWLAAQELLIGDPGEEINDVEPLPWSDDALAAAVAGLDGRAGTTFALLEHVAAHYPAWLRGEVHGARVLFSRDALALWEGYFDNANLTCGAVNALTAWAAGQVQAGDGLRVLEVGGGLASGALALLERLGPRVARYTFSEVAPVFLSRGEARLRAAHPRLDLQVARLDLNDPFAAQGIAPASQDLIVGVNTLHAVRDLVDTLARLRELLVPGGWLVLGESVRPEPKRPLAIELIFQLTREFQQAVAVPGLRDGGGFLPWASWPRLLEQAGFAAARCLPDLEAVHASYPGYALAAVVGRRPE